MFDLRMPLPMDFIYDVSYLFLVASWCSCFFINKENPKNWSDQPGLLFLGPV